MKKWNPVLISLSITCIMLTSFVKAAEKCVAFSANHCFGIHPSSGGDQFFSPVVYRPAEPNERLISTDDTGSGIGGVYFLRDKDDHSNQLYTNGGGSLKPTISESAPSGYPKGILTLNLESQDDVGNTLFCDYTFNRQNDSVKVCSVASNPDYCDVVAGHWPSLIIGKTRADQNKKF